MQLKDKIEGKVGVATCLSCIGDMVSDRHPVYKLQTIPDNDPNFEDDSSNTVWCEVCGKNGADFFVSSKSGCVVCGNPIVTMAFRNTNYCSERCRKAVEEHA